MVITFFYLHLYTTSFSYKTSTTGFGSKINGSWSGMVGMVMRGETDLAMSGMSVSSARAGVIDYLFSHWETSSGVLISLKSIKWHYFTSMFTYSVWLLIAALPLAVALPLYLIDYIHSELKGVQQEKSIPDVKQAELIKVNRSGDMRQEKTVPGVDDGVRQWHYIPAFHDHVYFAYGSILSQGQRAKDSPHSTRIILSSFWLSLVMLTAVYSGNLTATLAVKDYSMPFDTLDELAADDSYILQILDSSFRVQLFQDATTGIYKRLWQKLSRTPDKSFVSDQKIAYQRVIEGGYAFTATMTRLRELVRTTANCDLVFIKERYVKHGKALVIKQGVPYTKHFNMIVARLVGRGWIQVWDQMYSTVDTCGSRRMEADSVAVKLNDLTIALLCTLCLGLGVASTALLLEWLLHSTD